MYKEYFNTNIISSRVLFLSLCDLEQDKEAESINLDSAFYVHREFLPKSSTIDYIELKTKLGGCIFMQSMYNISFITYVKNNACNVYPATSDLNLVSDNQPKTKFRVRTKLIPVIGKDGQIVDPTI